MWNKGVVIKLTASALAVSAAVSLAVLPPARGRDGAAEAVRQAAPRTEEPVRAETLAAVGMPQVKALSADMGGPDTGNTAEPDRLKLELLEPGASHSPYILPRADGTLGPGEIVTRAEAAVLFYSLLRPVQVTGVRIADVPENAYYAPAVYALTAAGAMDLTNGEFRPDVPVTRAEFTAAAVRIRPDAETFLFPCVFLDVPAHHPYAMEIRVAAQRGWTYGADVNFRPESILTRAEAICILNRFAGRAPDTHYLERFDRSPFSDVASDHWAFYEIMEASIDHTHASTGVWSFSDTTVLKEDPGFHFEGVDYYYVDENGQKVVDGYYGGLYFGSDGYFTSGDAELDGYVKEVIADIYAQGKTGEEALHAAYNYTRDSFSYLRRNYYDTGETGWENSEALTMFKTKRGNCYCYAAVFYSLARQLGYDAVAIAGKVNNSNPIPHGWVEIWDTDQYYMYDTELEMSYRKKGNYKYNFYHMAYNKTPWRYWR